MRAPPRGLCRTERETPPSGPLLGPLFFVRMPKSHRTRSPGKTARPASPGGRPAVVRDVRAGRPLGPKPKPKSEQALAPEAVATRIGTVAPAETAAAVEEVAAPVLAAHRCELVQLEFRREPHGWVLRLYVERLGHDPRLAVGGVDLEACSRISRDLSMALDVAGTIEHAYHLEISSPGLERPLASLAHYARFAGLPAKLVLRVPYVRAESQAGHRVLQGELLGVDGERVRIHDQDLGEAAVPFGDIARAHLVYVPPQAGGPKKTTRTRDRQKHDKQLHDTQVHDVGRQDAENER